MKLAKGINNFSINKSTNEKNIKFFLIERQVFDRSCSGYIVKHRWDITFGTLTTPFKFRHDLFLFTTNLNLGTSVAFKKNILTDLSWGIVGGLSLSSITLDSFSTKGTILTNSERPAVTPSVSVMIGYKNINLKIGIGWDLINRISSLEKSWIYQGKRWIGIGIGINLFNQENPIQSMPAQNKK